MSNKYCSSGQLGKWITVFLMLGLSVACISGKVATKTPESLLAAKSQSPDIRGVVIDLYIANDNLNGFYIEGVLEDDTRYDKASVRFTERTRIFQINGDQVEVVTFQALKKGQIVEIIFVPGEILERYPVSAEAQEILIISQ